LVLQVRALFLPLFQCLVRLLLSLLGREGMRVGRRVDVVQQEGDCVGDLAGGVGTGGVVVAFSTAFEQVCGGKGAVLSDLEKAVLALPVGKREREEER
jgi:hypothetical protein